MKIYKQDELKQNQGVNRTKPNIKREGIMEKIELPKIIVEVPGIEIEVPQLDENILKELEDDSLLKEILEELEK